MKRLLVQSLRMLDLYPPAPEGEMYPSEGVLDLNAEKKFDEYCKQRQRLISSDAYSRNIIILTTSVGSLGTLASSNFFSSFMAGFQAKGVRSQIVACEQSAGEIIGNIVLLPPILWTPQLAGYSGQELASRAIICESPDVILAHWSMIPQYSNQLSDARNKGSLAILSVGESPLVKYPDDKIRRVYIKHVRECCDGILVVSRYLKEFWIEQGFSKKQIYVTKTPVRAAQNEYTGSSDGFHAVYFGNLAHKEIDNLIEIAQTVAHEFTDFQLTVFGDASAEEAADIQSRVYNQGLTEHISILPPVSYAEMMRELAYSDVALLPREDGEFSKAGFPNKLGEYLSSGIPVVVTGVGEIPNVLQNGVHARVVTPGDNAAFAQAVVEVLSDKSEACMMGEDGRTHIQEYAGAKMVAGELLEWIESLEVL